MSQVVSAEFSVIAALDNHWTLKLKKDKTYKYVHWSGFSGSSTLDSGTYIIQGTQIRFKTKLDTSLKWLHQQPFFLSKIRIKRYQNLIHQLKSRRFSVFGKKYLLMSKDTLDKGRVWSERSIDRIRTESVDDSVDISKWLEKNVLPLSGYRSLSEMPDSVLIWIYRGNKIEVILTPNSWGRWHVGIRHGNQIRSFILTKSRSINKRVIRKMFREARLENKLSMKVREDLWARLKRLNIFVP